ncbi:MAG: hypothetical protein RL344_667 [Pseudomonadota bacterium]|jgi:hypothetical protein
MNRSYISEATAFIQSLKANNPQLEQSQRDGRALLWDKLVSLSDLANQSNKNNKVPNKPYVYATIPDKKLK